MKIERWFYMRDDLKDDYRKLRLYKSIFTCGLCLGLALLTISIMSPIVPFGIFAGGFSFIISGYFLLSIYIHMGGKR